MSLISCFGNATIGELANAQLLNFNNLKSLKFDRGSFIDGGTCAIPGYRPPNLPTFVVPPIPFFNGMLPLGNLCVLPPFPGLPALSLPGISISIPPLPFLPPIIIPIPGFALPKLPTLPKFDLGSLSFLCNFIQIKLPILDPFSSINDAIRNANSLVDSLNEFLNFCKQNTETIANVEIPNNPGYTTSTTSDLNKSVIINFTENNTTGLSAPTISNFSGSSNKKRLLNSPTKAQISAALKDVKFTNYDTGEQVLYFLADAGLIPAEPALLSSAANEISNRNASSLTADELALLLSKHNIATTDQYIGFTTTAIQSVRDRLKDDFSISDFVNGLTNLELIQDNLNVKNSVRELLTALSAANNLSDYSNLTLAMKLNEAKIPFGKDGSTLISIDTQVLSNALFNVNLPFPISTTNLVNSLVGNGTIDNAPSNITNALRALSPLPVPLTLDSLATRLQNIRVGRSVGSQIAITNIERSSTIKDKVISLLPQVEAKLMTFFSREFIYPVTTQELIALIAIYLQVDQFGVEEVFAQAPRVFSSSEEIENFIQSLKIDTIFTYSYSYILTVVQKIINNYDNPFPLSTTQPQFQRLLDDIQRQLKVSRKRLISVLSTTMNSTEEIAFYIFASGILNKAQFTTEMVGAAFQYAITIQSPNNRIDDILISTLNITFSVMRNGIKSSEKIVILGTAVNGSLKITKDNFSRLLKVHISPLIDLNLQSDYITDIDVQIQYRQSTVLAPELIQSAYIKIESV